MGDVVVGVEVVGGVVVVALEQVVEAPG